MHTRHSHSRHEHSRNRNLPHAFAGRRSRVYDLVARRLLRGVYRGLADDIARSAPADATVLDVGTGPGVLLAELARRRPDLRLVGIDLSADMITAAARNLAPSPTGPRPRSPTSPTFRSPTASSTSSSRRSACTTGTTRRPRSASWPGCCGRAGGW